MMIDRLGTLSLRSSRIMVVVILAVAVGFVLVQLKLVVIPLLIVFAVQDQWGTLARSATTGIDTIQEFLENGPIPIDQAQLDSVRDTVVAFQTSAQFGSGADRRRDSRRHSRSIDRAGGERTVHGVEHARSRSRIKLQSER